MFEKDAKLCLKTDQLLILQEYFQQLLPNLSGATSGSEYNPSTSSSITGDLKSNNGNKRRTSTLTNAANSSSNKEFLLLYKSNQLHIIQDFMFKITNLKVIHNRDISNNLKDVMFNNFLILDHFRSEPQLDECLSKSQHIRQFDLFGNQKHPDQQSVRSANSPQSTRDANLREIAHKSSSNR